MENDQEEQERELTYLDIYKKLLLSEDMILEIGGEDLHRLRKGISSVKARDNAKLKDSGLPVERFKIDYMMLGENQLTKTVKIRIRIVRPDTVMVKNLIISEGL